MEHCPKVCVVVLNWNRPHDTIECIESVANLDYPNFEIVVIDNGSTDDSSLILEERFPGLTLIANRQNLGYAGGNNVGIRVALGRGAEWVLLLNNDTVVDRGLLKGLLGAASADPQAGVLGAKILDHREPNKVWFAGADIDWSSGESVHLGLGQIDSGQFESVVQVDRACGCAMLVKRAVFEKIGLLDPEYFLYYEDTDFCVRAKKAGFKNLCVRSAKVWHKESLSTGAKNGSALHTYYHTRNKLLFLKKHLPGKTEAERENREFCRIYIRHVLQHPFDRTYRRMYSPRFWAIADFYRSRFGMKAAYHKAARP